MALSEEQLEQWRAAMRAVERRLREERDRDERLRQASARLVAERGFGDEEAKSDG